MVAWKLWVQKLVTETEGITRKHFEVTGGFLDYGDSFTGVCTCVKTYQTVHLNLCSLLFANYTSIKLFQIFLSSENCGFRNYENRLI